MRMPSNLKERERMELRPSAMQRLCRAQEQLTSARQQNIDTKGISGEWEVSKYSAAVAGSKQWLYWVDYGESIFPEADGDWA